MTYTNPYRLGAIMTSWLHIRVALLLPSCTVSPKEAPKVVFLLSVSVSWCMLPANVAHQKRTKQNKEKDLAIKYKTEFAPHFRSNNAVDYAPN